MSGKHPALEANRTGHLRPPARYRWLVRLLTPLVLLHLVHRRRKDGDRRYLCERLGRCVDPGADRRAGPGADPGGTAVPPLWIHAASVGEAMTILPLLDALSRAHPTTPLLVTTNTTTGARVVAEKAHPEVRHRYLPLDLPGATRRFLDEERPVAGWIVETEIWPWLFARAQTAGIPLTIINGRLSPRTRRQSTGWLGDTYRRALSGVDVLARSADDAEAFIRLGAESVRVEVIGEMKYARRHTASTGGTPPRPVASPFVLAASTHADEEVQLARAWLASRADGLLIIVPRHPERGEQLSADLGALIAPIPCRRRALGDMPEPADRLYLADTLGELDDFYAHARGVFVGGSLIERGGHNVLEPARLRQTVAVGPHTSNFSEPVALLCAADALTVCPNAKAVADFLTRAWQEDPLLQRQGRRAQAAAESMDGIVERYLDRLRRAMPQQPPG